MANRPLMDLHRSPALPPPPGHAGRRGRALRAMLGILIAIAVTLFPLSAHARAQVVERDRTDNTFYFSYEAATGSIPSAESSARYTRDDKVGYYVYVSENDGAGPGERLVATLELHLVGSKTVAYDGRFIVKVSGENAVYTRAKEARVVLRPRKGERTARLRIVFDLPSGDYKALGRFRTV